MDAQGHGLSDRLGPDFSFENHSKQVAGLIQELRLIKPIIMGHSMGGAITCNVAMEYPDLPKAIILEDPPWGIFPPKPGNEEESRKNHEKIRVRGSRWSLFPVSFEKKYRCSGGKWIHKGWALRNVCSGGVRMVRSWDWRRTVNMPRSPRDSYVQTSAAKSVALILVSENSMRWGRIPACTGSFKN